MRTILSAIFASMAIVLTAQEPEKGYEYYMAVHVKISHSDGSEVFLLELTSNPVASDYTGDTDTISYELHEGDSVTVTFDLGDDSGIETYDAFWPLHEELIYGDPVFEYLDIGNTSVGGNAYMHEWSFTDSAEFSFKLYMLGNPTHVVKLTRNPALGLGEASTIPVAVFPNPFSSGVYLQLPDENTTKLSLTDASGRQVKTWTCEGSQYIDLADFSSGSYILCIETQEKVSTFRLQKTD